MVNKKDAANTPGTRERLLCLGCAQTLFAGNASSCRISIRLHTCPGTQLHLPSHQLILVIFSKYYFAGFFPCLFVKSTNSHHCLDAPDNRANGADSRGDEHMCTSRNTHGLLQCWQPASLYESQGQVSTSHRARNPLSQTLG